MTTATTTQTHRAIPLDQGWPDSGGADAGGSWFEHSTGAMDAGTNAGLRGALEVVGVDGWSSPAGRAVLAALAHRSRAWAACRVKASHLPRAVVEPGDVLSVGWLTLARFTGRVAAAEAPWAYLWRAVHNELAVEGAATMVLSRSAVQVPATAWPDSAVRVGLLCSLDAGAEFTPGRAASSAMPGVRSEPSAALAALVEHLGHGEETESAFWLDAIAHAIDVMSAARRSYEEVTLRRDTYLCDVLGLSPQEVSALAALLIGPRRGDRAGRCLLLALHRDPDADPAEVPGARARIALLRSGRARLTPGAPAAAEVAA